MKRYVLASTLAAFCFSASAQTPINLITFVAPQPAQSPPGEFLESWSAGFNTASLSSGISSLRLNLPDGAVETVDLVYFEPRHGYLAVDLDGDGDTEDVIDPNASPEEISWRWYGRSSNWTVALTLESGVLAGRISGPDHRYGIKPGRNGTTLLGLVNSEHWQLHSGDTDEDAHQLVSSIAEPDKKNDELSSKSVAVPMAWDTTCAAPLEPGVRVVDLLILYTSGVVDSSGGTSAGARAAIQSSMDDVSQSLRNTGISRLKFALRGIEAADTLVSYDTLSLSDALRAFGGWEDLPAPDYIGFPGNSHVLARRNANEADIVALARAADDGTCGVSLIQHKTLSGYLREPGAGFEKFAYLVFNPNCNADRLNLAHELGHLFGMEHDPKNATSVLAATRSCPWSHGHRRTSTIPGDPLRFRTVMSYWQNGSASGGPGGCGSSTGCPLIDAYSSTAYEWNGASILPVGTSTSALMIGVPYPAAPNWAAKADDTLVRLAKIVEQFRTSSEIIFLDNFQ
ncbi:M12 family metallo-peptidase [Tahibacter harae]|uniref:Zinc-dependent metalloprotease n=1 Tax=Tahibacter harae TaxID=2963937 RepID=A0ABT1QQQ8_9GAMM|nr:M12 family metallo-peptidase [Tahibacter harae]MCQ4164604.1 zinc-dependent metalloprotease [Tahibacter harae]